MTNATALDTTIAVVTPENIAFEYQLAGPFRRLPAYAIDVVARWTILCIILAAVWIGVGLFSGATGTSILGPFAVGFSLILLFVVSQFYGTLLETIWNGRTIGKRMMGIRVIDVDGGPIDMKRAFLRNLVRIADLLPIAPLAQFSDDIPPFAILTVGTFGFITMISTRRMQRLGDLAAGTMVIVDERSWQLPIAKVDDARVPALASFIPGDYRISRSMARTLAIYAERRHYLTPPRRREICRHLVEPLLDRFEFRGDIDADLLMYALYHRTFLDEDTNEAPDLGPLAGYSPLRKDAHKVKGFTGTKTAAVGATAKRKLSPLSPVTRSTPEQSGVTSPASKPDAPNSPPTGGSAPE